MSTFFEEARRYQIGFFCGQIALNTGCGDVEDELLKYFGVK